MSSTEALPDPCPTPYAEQAIAKATGKSKRTRLGEKQKILFAPMSDVGGVLVDKDAVYINLATTTLNPDDLEQKGIGEQMMIGLQGSRDILGKSDTGMRLFSGGDLVDGRADDTDDMGRKSQRQARIADGEDIQEADLEGISSDEEFAPGDEGEDRDELPETNTPPAFTRRNDAKTKETSTDNITWADSDSDLGSVSGEEDDLDLEDEPIDDYDEDYDDERALQWKSNLTENARKSHGRNRPYRTADLARMMYDLSLSPSQVITKWRGDKEEAEEESVEDGGDDFFKKTMIEQESEDRTIPTFQYTALEEKWEDPDNIEALRSRFIVGHLSSHSGDGDDDGEPNGFEGFEDDSEGDGEFEDLETGEKVAGRPQGDMTIEQERENNARRKEELKLRFEEEDREGTMKQKDGGDEVEEFGEDEWFDQQKSLLRKQLEINRNELDQLDEASRIRVEGHKAGTYARIVLEKVPYEFCRNFNPRFPILIGGLTQTEERFGFVQVRIKRHRWFKKILKSNDPLIFSLGWRRFQTL